MKSAKNDKGARALMPASARPGVTERTGVSALPAALPAAPVAIVASVLPPQIVTRMHQMRFNPLRQLTAESLTRALDSFLYGDLKQAVWLWEAIADRDDTISSVKPKREKSSAHREWKVLLKNDDDSESPAAKEHQAILKRFWSTATAVNAYDRNERGGMSRIMRQMMSAISYKYAVHHIVWKPTDNELRAEFEFVPLSFFENRTGTLRFIADGISTNGQEMDAGDWMVTVGDGLMIAGSIAYYFKRLSLQDLVAFSEKFGTPGVVGRTRSGRDTEAGKAMADAVTAFGSDWSAVMYGDEGDGKIELIEAKSSAATLPMPLIIERIDKKLAALWRGADLSSMSSGKESAGQGASLQDSETKILERDDAAIISETLAQVERTVIAWHFGADTEPLAGIKVMVPQDEDLQLMLATIVALTNLGAPFDMADVLTRFGFAVPRDKATLLKASPTARDISPAMNDRRHALHENALRDALLKDQTPVREALVKILEADTPEQLANAVRIAQHDYPELVQAVLSNDEATRVLAELAGEEMIEQFNNAYIPGVASNAHWVTIDGHHVSLKDGASGGGTFEERRAAFEASPEGIAKRAAKEKEKNKWKMKAQREDEKKRATIAPGTHDRMADTAIKKTEAVLATGKDHTIDASAMIKSDNAITRHMGERMHDEVIPAKIHARTELDHAERDIHDLGRVGKESHPEAWPAVEKIRAAKARLGLYEET